jgi:hypothetical protein
MAILKNEENESNRLLLFRRIERFIFIVFRMTSARANYRSSEFYNAARAVDRREIDPQQSWRSLTTAFLTPLAKKTGS